MYRTHTSETLEETLDHRGITYNDLVTPSVPLEYWQDFQERKICLSSSAVRRLTEVTGVPVSFWLQMDLNYWYNRAMNTDQH